MDQGVEVADSMSTKDYKFKLPTMADHLFMYATTEGIIYLKYIILNENT